MQREKILGKLCVKDVRRLIVKSPSTVRESDSLTELLKKIIEDPRTRHVYVVDENNILIGVVRMNSVVQYLFPFEAMANQSSEIVLSGFAKVNMTSLADIMNHNPRYVCEQPFKLENTSRHLASAFAIEWMS